MHKQHLRRRALQRFFHRRCCCCLRNRLVMALQAVNLGARNQAHVAQLVLRKPAKHTVAGERSARAHRAKQRSRQGPTALPRAPPASSWTRRGNAHPAERQVYLARDSRSSLSLPHPRCSSAHVTSSQTAHAQCAHAAPSLRSPPPGSDLRQPPKTERTCSLSAASTKSLISRVPRTKPVRSRLHKPPPAHALCSHLQPRPSPRRSPEAPSGAKFNRTNWPLRRGDARRRRASTAVPVG